MNTGSGGAEDEREGDGRMQGSIQKSYPRTGRSRDCGWARTFGPKRREIGCQLPIEVMLTRQ
jgi:hypothetical protein